MRHWRLKSLLALTLASQALSLTAAEPRIIRPVAIQAPAKESIAAPAKEPGTAPAELPAPNNEPVERLPQPWNLAHLTSLTDENNPVLRRDLARVEAAQGVAVQARLWPNPRIDSGNPQQLASYSSVYSTGFIQTIVTKGKLRLDQAAALEGVRMSELTYQQDRYEVIRAVRQQFYETLSGQVRMQVLQRMKTIVNDSLSTAIKLEKGGEGNHTDVLLLGIEARRVELALQNVQTLLKGSRRQLAAQVGIPEMEIGQVVGNLKLAPPAFDEQALRDFLSTQNVQLLFSQVDIGRRQILLRRAQVEPFPNIDTGLGYQYALTPYHNQGLVYLAAPLPLWNRNQGNIRAATANVSEAEQSMLVVRNGLINRGTDALARYNVTREIAIQYEREILPKANEALKLALDGYRKGEFDFARFLQAQRVAIEAELNYINNLETLWLTAAELGELMQLEEFP